MTMPRQSPANPVCLLPERDLVREALEPVLDWYQSDEHDERPTDEILAEVIEDLQTDRQAVLDGMKELKAARKPLKIATQALTEISSPTQSTNLLWWQKLARVALSEIQLEEGADG